MAVQPQFRRGVRNQRGYVLLTLILAVALLAIATAIILPKIEFQLKRDREEELVHRGTQYSRAIKHYVKKFGRYPTKIEDLENTNQVRFLRRRYKDPITGKDFKILHMGDVQMMMVGAVGGVAGGVPGNPLSPAGQPAANGAPGGQANAAGGANASPFAGNFGAIGTTVNPMTLNNGGAMGATTTAGSNATASANPNANSASEGEGDDGETGANPASPGGQNPLTPTSGPLGQQPGGQNGSQVFGGGPMVGVASLSDKKTIRIFNKKDRYNQWQFIYDPSTDRGGLISTPAMGIPQFQSIPQNGAPAGQPGVGQPGVGQPGPGLGAQPPGLGARPNPPGSGMQPPPSPPDENDQ